MYTARCERLMAHLCLDWVDENGMNRYVSEAQLWMGTLCVALRHDDRQAMTICSGGAVVAIAPAHKAAIYREHHQIF